MAYDQKSPSRCPFVKIEDSAPIGPSQPATSQWLIALAAVVIALVATAAYYNSFAGVFAFDDHAWIVNNTNIWNLRSLGRVLYPPDDVVRRGRPVVSLTLAVNYALGGTNVWGYHAVNLAVHLLAAWTLFGVLRRTFALPCLRDRFGPAAVPLALAATLLWTVHPLQTESVTYIIQRTEALVGLFYLLTLYCVIRGASGEESEVRGQMSGSSIHPSSFILHPSPTLWYVASVIVCLLGMGTKEVMATAPLIVLLYDRTFLAGSFREAWRRRYGLYLAMAASWGVVAAALISTGFHGDTTGFSLQKFTWWLYLLTQPGVIVHYLRLAFWPSALCIDYNWPPAQTAAQVILPGLVVVGLLALTVWAIRKRPALGFLGAWFFVILAPSSSFVPIRDAAFEHRMYLPLAAVAVAAAIGAWAAGQWLVGRALMQPSAVRASGWALAAFCVAALAVLTAQRNAVYHSELSIWQDAADKAPGSARAENNLALCLSNCQRIDEAIDHYHKALQIDPDFAEAHNGLGAVLAGLGRYDEALSYYQKAIKINPNLADVCNNLGLALVQEGKFEQAVVQYKNAVRVKPGLVDAYTNMGLAFAKWGRSDDAMAAYRKAIEIKPDCTDAHCNLGAALANRGQTEAAIAEYRKTLQIDPRHLNARTNLGLALAASGQMEDAIAEYRKALEVNPDLAEACNYLGKLLIQVGRGDQAIAQYKRACELKPDYAEARHNLGMALAERGQWDDAIAQYRRALEIKPDYADAHNTLGTALLSRGRDRDAAVHFEKALAIEPDYAEAHNNLGIVLANRGQTDEAIVHFRRALKINPNYDDAKKNLAIAMKR